jgi:hypothetical protein
MIFRQEYLGMQTKYHALESRSKELLLSQSSAVSGASVALSGLGNRLELLVDQLITSYNISESDLEVSRHEIRQSTEPFHPSITCFSLLAIPSPSLPF